MVPKPKIAFLVTADSHKEGYNAKTDAFGIFNTFFVWGYPATRKCSVILGVTDASDPFEIRLWLEDPSKSRRTLGKIDARPKVPSHAALIPQEIQVEIRKPGKHRIGASIADGPIRWIPLLVVERPWPAPLEGDQLAAVLATPHAVKSATATLRCGKCGKTYLFEVLLDPAQPLRKGAMAFPTDGIFRCPECKTIHRLRDLEGQLRSHLGQVVSGEPA
jgi:hypothetical protein